MQKQQQGENTHNLLNLLDTEDLQKQPVELRQICERIFSSGKGFRSRLVSLVGRFIGLDAKQQQFLSRIVEYIHNSSLLHDDFIDRSRRRRNFKTAWLEFSPSQAVLAGDYLLAKTNIYLSQTENPLLIQKTAEVICQLAEGEFLQRELLKFKNKDLKKRDQISNLKTASLFKWCLQAPFIYKRRQEEELINLLNQIGQSLGLLFQRSDDLMDFAIRNKDKKPYFADLRQKHFNSFACFLLKKAGSEKERKLKHIRSKSSLLQLFPDLESSVKEFDQLNGQIIKKSESNIEKIEPFLKGGEKGLISHLQKLPGFLYYRRDKL